MKNKPPISFFTWMITPNTDNYFVNNKQKKYFSLKEEKFKKANSLNKIVSIIRVVITISIIWFIRLYKADLIVPGIVLLIWLIFVSVPYIMIYLKFSQDYIEVEYDEAMVKNYKKNFIQGIFLKILVLAMIVFVVVFLCYLIYNRIE